MPRPNSTSINVDKALAAKIDAAIEAAGYNYSRNQFIEEVVSQCINSIENSAPPAVPLLVREFRARLGKSEPIPYTPPPKHEFENERLKLEVDALRADLEAIKLYLQKPLPTPKITPLTGKALKKVLDKS